MEYTFSPVTTVDKTAYLEFLIEDFLSDFIELYPDRPLVPMHYLVHVPMWIRRYVLCVVFTSMLSPLSLILSLQVWTIGQVVVYAL